ncbi:MAG: dihydroorotase [Rhodospirillales bacterium]|nr:dihydroorotase [Rhodospirillales bacterium]
MTGKLIAYTNARLLDPATDLDRPGGVLTEGKTILDFGADLFKDGVPDGAEVIDCSGNCLAPGFVDMRVQLREPGEEHKGTLASAGATAVAGGVTTMACLPNTNPVIDDTSVLEFIARRARKIGLAKVFSYGAVTKGLEGKELAEMGMLSEAGAVAFTDGVKTVSNAKTMRRALGYAKNFNLLVVQHAEEPSLAEDGAMNGGETATRLGLPGIPAEAEVIIVARDIRLAEAVGGRIHFAHISTADSLHIIRKGKERGVQVTCDTAPPYFSLNELSVGEYRTFCKLSPPLRLEADRIAIIEGIKDGTISAIASDHDPQDEDAKRLPFAQAAFGGVGLETLLPISLNLYHTGEMDLLQVIKKITCDPADILNLPAGRLVKGAAADLTIFNPDIGWKIEPDNFASKSKNSPFDGRPVQGRVLRTIVDGRTVFELDN